MADLRSWYFQKSVLGNGGSLRLIGVPGCEGGTKVFGSGLFGKETALEPEERADAIVLPFSNTSVSFSRSFSQRFKMFFLAASLRSFALVNSSFNRF